MRCSLFLTISPRVFILNKRKLYKGKYYNIVMGKRTAVAMVRKNKLNGQKTITVPKRIESIEEFDNIKFDEDEKGKVNIEKLNQ